MKVCHTLICFFFLMLQDGNIGLINAQIPFYTRTVGQSITVQCHFKTTSGWKYFCKEKCKEYILEMNDDSYQRDRYSMRYYETSGGSRLDVTITQLRKSDSGRYWCGLENYYWGGPHKEFKINVRDARTPSKPKPTVRPAPPLTPPTQTTQSFRRSSTPSTFSAQTTKQSEQETTTAGGSGPCSTVQTTSGVMLYVGLTLVLIVLLFSMAVLILCKKRASKPKEHPEETECANVTEASRVYEEIREGDGLSTFPPVENSVEASDVYSVVTATASRPLSKTEDDLNELDYTEVDLSNRAATSLSSAPSGQVANVIYSALQTHTDAKVASQPLYSTITSPQQ